MNLLSDTLSQIRFGSAIEGLLTSTTAEIEFGVAVSGYVARPGLIHGHSADRVGRPLRRLQLNRLLACLNILIRLLLGGISSHAGDFGHHAERDLRQSLAAQLEPGGTLHARECFIRDTFVA